MVKLIVRLVMVFVLLVVIKITADLVFCAQIGQLGTVHVKLGARIQRSVVNSIAAGGVKSAEAWYSPSDNEVVIGDLISILDGTLVHECTHAWDHNTQPTSNMVMSYRGYYAEYNYETLYSFWSGSEAVADKELYHMCTYGRQNSTEFLACSIQSSYDNAMSARFYAMTGTHWYQAFGSTMLVAPVATGCALGLVLCALWMVLSTVIKSVKLRRQYGTATDADHIIALALFAMRISEEVVVCLSNGQSIIVTVCSVNVVTGTMWLSTSTSNYKYEQPEIISVRFK